jgi:DHA1 family tetracycline resistance protein-like MFS transporter
MHRAFRAAPPMLVVLIEAMTMATLAPILAPLVANPPPHGLMSDLSASSRNLLYGAALGLQPLLAMCSAPLLGQLSDRLGRKTILLYTMSGLTLAAAGIGLAISSGWVVFLFASMVISGLSAGNQAVAQATLVDMSPPDRKALYLSLALLSSSVGFLAGPLLGGLLSDASVVSWFRPDVPFYALGAASFVTVVLIVVMVPGLPPEKLAAPEPIDPMSGVRALVSSFGDRTLGRISLVFVFMQMAWAAYFLFLPMFLVTTEGFSRSETSAAMAAMGAGFLASYAVGLPLLSKYWSARAIARAGLLLTAAGMLGGALAGQGPVQWLLIMVTGFVVSIAYGAILTLYADAVDASRQGQILGISIAVVSFSWGVSSIAAGYLSGASPWAPIVMATAFMTMSFLAALALPAPRDKAEGPQHAERTTA